MANLDYKYLNGNGLRTFFDYINGLWWDSKKDSLSNNFLSTTGGALSGELTVNSNINSYNLLPTTNNTYNLGAPGSDNGDDALVWNSIYVSNVYAENLTIAGSISGTTSSAQQTEGTFYLGNYSDSEADKIEDVFSVNGSKNIYLSVSNGL